MIEPQRNPKSEKEPQHASLKRVVLEVGSLVGCSAKFVLFEFQGELYFRSARQSAHHLIVLNFRDELENHGLSGSPKIIEGGNFITIEQGIKLVSIHSFTLGDTLGSRKVTEATRFLREHHPEVTIESDEEQIV